MKTGSENSGGSLLANLPMFCDGFTKIDKMDVLSIPQEPKFMAEWTQGNDTGEKLQNHTNLLAFRVRTQPQRSLATKRLLSAMGKSDYDGKRKNVEKKRKVEKSNNGIERSGRNKDRNEGTMKVRTKNIEQWTSSRLRSKNREHRSGNSNDVQDDKKDEDYEEDKYASSDDDDFM